MSLSKKYLSIFFASVLVLSSTYTSFAEFESENGLNHIVGSKHDKSITENDRANYVFSSYEKNATFYLYNSKNIKMYNSPSSSSASVGELSPQLLVASKRKGDWFYINTFLGNKWVYQDDNVSLREIEDMNNDIFTTSEPLTLHSQPFNEFSTGKTIPVGNYPIKKKSGDWFYTESNGYSGWFCTKKGKFENSISTLDVSSINNIPLKVKLAKPSNNVRPGMPMKPKYITIHNTANTGKGANAAAHANLLYNQSINGDRTASWHFTVDNKEIYQSLPLDEIGYHAGDGSGPGNRSSIGIEICENKDGNYLQGEQHAAELTAYLLHKFDLPLSSVKPHQAFSGKFCPARILERNNGWNNYMSKVEKAYNSMTPPTNNKTYYLDINSFLGEDAAKNAMNRIKNDTGWYMEYKQMEEYVSEYKIETGSFVGEDNVKSALETLKNTTGLNGEYTFTGSYSETQGTPIYHIETGGFVGEDNVKSALAKLQELTGWWATYEPNGSNPNEFKIVTGGFAGEDSAKSALSKLQELTGWWATYKFSGTYDSVSKIPVYRIDINGFIGEYEAQVALQNLKNVTGWWAESKVTDNKIHHYRVISGGFVGLDNANKQAQFVRDKYGWYTEVKPQ